MTDQIPARRVSSHPPKFLLICVALVLAFAPIAGLTLVGGLPSDSAPTGPACQHALAHQGYAVPVASGYDQAEPPACQGILVSIVQALAEADVTSGLRTAPSLASASAASSCASLAAQPTAAGTMADATCIQDVNGMPADLATFATPEQQATFVVRSMADGNTVISQGLGWVLS